MILLQANDLRKYYGPEALLDGVTLEIRGGRKIGLVGPNGAGKTTLLKVLAERLDADGGCLSRHESATVGYLEQQPEFSPSATVWDVAQQAVLPILEMIAQAENVAASLADCQDELQRKRWSARYDWLQHELQVHEAFHLDRRLDRVLDGLRFDAEQRNQPVEQLSGGQQNRLLLAQLLLAEPDVMLLDEPSNHLDLETTQWLEEFLIASSQAAVIVSHDRYLLDRVTTDTWELLQGTIDTYKGNFSAYSRRKAERLQVQRRTFERQQAEAARLEDFVRRNRYGQKHAQAEDRRKKLKRMEFVVTPREIFLPPMFFPAAARSGDLVFRAEHMSKAFDAPLFEDLSFDILRGQRWGVLGPNGSGKTTLIRCLLELEPLSAGRVIRGTGVKPGYFDQRLASVDVDALLVDAVRPTDTEMDEPARRSLLARFGLTGEMVFSKVGSLSGGERSRAGLARLAGNEANLLILDEPTNHLDLWARQALEEAIRKFEGTVLMVTHDRFFLDRVADHLLVFEPGGPRVFPGSYSDYVRFRNQTEDEGGSADRVRQQPLAPAPPRRQPADASKRAKPKRRFPYRRVTDIENDILGCESRIEELHEMLIQPEILRDGNAVKRCREELSTLQERRSRLYEHWEEAVELN